mmetsp:Transcript_19703/g.22530  ORF Transcript_19703/g.22530 Transcript_19703/m.22530 type:complete len:528 (+) Transcript_19703:60-1643(+)
MRMILTEKKSSALVWLALALISVFIDSPSCAVDAFSSPTVGTAAAASVTTPAAVKGNDRLLLNSTSKPLPKEVPVAIIGGGLGGLAVFCALQSRGIDAHIFESAPTLLRGSTGTGIMISENGMSALEAADRRLPDKMRGSGTRIVKQRIRVTDPLGAIEREIAFNMTKEQVNIGWSRAQEILASLVPEKFIHCGAQLESYQLVQKSDEGDDTTTDMVDVTFADGRSVRTSLLIGADGAGSAVRRVMAHAKNPKKAKASYAARYSGQLLWNAIVPTKDIQPLVHGTGEVEYITCGTDGQVVLTFDAGEEQTSWYLTLMEDYVKGAEGNALCPEIRTALEDNAFGGFGRKGVKKQLEQAFASWPVALACIHATQESQIFERRLSDRPALKDWTDPTCRVVLMGDAAHPMIPSQGQGTMMTWEDAADLAACVAPSLLKELRNSTQNDSVVDLSTAVRAFVSHRTERCARVQKFSAEAYMGSQSSKFFPLKVIQMLGRKRSMEFIKDGYQPILIPEKVGLRKRFWSLFQRN